MTEAALLPVPCTSAEDTDHSPLPVVPARKIHLVEIFDQETRNAVIVSDREVSQ